MDGLSKRCFLAEASQIVPLKRDEKSRINKSRAEVFSLRPSAFKLPLHRLKWDETYRRRVKSSLSSRRIKSPEGFVKWIFNHPPPGMTDGRLVSFPRPKERGREFRVMIERERKMLEEYLRSVENFESYRKNARRSQPGALRRVTSRVIQNEGSFYLRKETRKKKGKWKKKKI